MSALEEEEEEWAEVLVLEALFALMRACALPGAATRAAVVVDSSMLKGNGATDQKDQK